MSPARAGQGSQKKNISCTAAGLHRSCVREHAGMSTISTGQEGALTLWGAGERRSNCLGIEFLVAARSISLGKFFFLMYVGKSQCAKGK